MYEFITSAANGNEVTEYWDFTSCGDFPECHAEPPTCGCQPSLDEPPIGIVVEVRMFTLREQVAATVSRIREARATGHVSLEALFTSDLHALLAMRGQR